MRKILIFIFISLFFTKETLQCSTQRSPELSITLSINTLSFLTLFHKLKKASSELMGKGDRRPGQLFVHLPTLENLQTMPNPAITLSTGRGYNTGSTYSQSRDTQLGAITAQEARIKKTFRYSNAIGYEESDSLELELALVVDAQHTQSSQTIREKALEVAKIRKKVWIGLFTTSIFAGILSVTLPLNLIHNKKVIGALWYFLAASGIFTVSSACLLHYRMKEYYQINQLFLKNTWRPTEIELVNEKGEITESGKPLVAHLNLSKLCGSEIRRLIEYALGSAKIRKAENDKNFLRITCTPATAELIRAIMKSSPREE